MLCVKQYENKKKERNTFGHTLKNPIEMSSWPAHWVPTAALLSANLFICINSRNVGIFFSFNCCCKVNMANLGGLPPKATRLEEECAGRDCLLYCIVEPIIGLLST